MTVYHSLSRCFIHKLSSAWVTTPQTTYHSNSFWWKSMLILASWNIATRISHDIQTVQWKVPILIKLLSKLYQQISNTKTKFIINSLLYISNFIETNSLNFRPQSTIINYTTLQTKVIVTSHVSQELWEINGGNSGERRNKERRIKVCIGIRVDTWLNHLTDNFSL